MDPRAATRPNPRCTKEACRSLLALLEGAKASIDFAVYGLRRQPQLLAALVAAKGRGVRVRGVVDVDLRGESYYVDTPSLIEQVGSVRTDYEVDRESAETPRYSSREPPCQRPAGFAGPLQCVAYDLGDRCLSAGHASIEELRFSGDLMHHKFFVVDGRHVWTGSANVSDTDLGGYSANMVVQLDAPEVARWYTEELEQMFVHGRYHAKKVAKQRAPLQLSDGTVVEVLFTPQDKPMRAVRKALRGAKERIDVAVFFLTHKEIAGDLIDAHLRGVRVRVILDATAATNGYTKHTLLRAAGVPVKVESWGGKMHAKSAVIDGELVIAGSMNWTSAGERANDENTLLLHSAAHAKAWSEWFDVLWADIDDRWLSRDPAPESRHSGSACTDGIDNDFDHDVDKKDSGCGPTPPPPVPMPPYRLKPKSGDRCLPTR